MGYISDVDIIIYGPEEYMTGFISAQRILGKKWLEYDYETRQFYYSDKNLALWTMIIMSYGGVKWNPTGEYATNWNVAMDAASDHEHLNYECVIVGEEEGDIESDRGGNNVAGYLYTSTAIEDDFPEFILEETKDEDDG